MSPVSLSPRQLSLAIYLECEYDDLSLSYGNTFLFGNQEYMILTDSESDEMVSDYIKDSIWAFNADFIISECGLDYSGEASLERLQRDSCEGANDFLLSLVEATCGLDNFVQSAVSSDGRGHFLSSYDGDENDFYLEDHLYGVDFPEAVICVLIDYYGTADDYDFNSDPDDFLTRMTNDFDEDMEVYYIYRIN